MVNLKLTCILLLVFLTTHSFAQYKGGDGDGSSMAITSSSVTLGDCIDLKEFYLDDNQEEISVTAFPNPFPKQSTLMIDGTLDPGTNYSIVIFNVFNQRIAEIRNLQSNEVRFELDQTAGAFVYRLYAGEKVIWSGLLLKVAN